MATTMKDRFKILRGNKTLEEFGSEIGISKQTLSKYENGKRSPNAEVLTIFANHSININWLLTGKGKIYISDDKAVYYPMVAEKIKL